ncbi:hypothetical protein BGW80DRAFT_146035 [Lactifluus volemus]|nr:hypothetical protein BGW80DRAFT_146035 [Lactifluus volemus]
MEIELYTGVALAFHCSLLSNQRQTPSTSTSSLLARMVNFRDPIVLFQDFLVLVKLWHAFGGIFLWEFFTTLDFEWNVIRGRRPYRWTIWIYSLTRISTLLVVILNMIAFDASRPIHCQLVVTFQLILAHLAVASASLLIMLRVIAIWNRNRTVLALAISVWGINVAFLIQGVLRSAFGPEATTCVVRNSDIAELNVIVTFVTDIILLLMMLAGLLHLRRQGGGLLDLGNFLWKQGIIWILLAVAAGVPPAVFLILNLNGKFLSPRFTGGKSCPSSILPKISEALNLMFQIPGLIILTISATRIYRSLIQFSSDNIDSVQSNGHSFVKPEVRVKVEPVHYNLMTQTSHFRSHAGTEGQLGIKARGQGLEDGLAGGMERKPSVLDSPV